MVCFLMYGFCIVLNCEISFLIIILSVFLVFYFCWSWVLIFCFRFLVLSNCWYILNIVSVFWGIELLSVIDKVLNLLCVVVIVWVNNLCWVLMLLFFCNLIDVKFSFGIIMKVLFIVMFGVFDIFLSIEVWWVKLFSFSNFFIFVWVSWEVSCVESVIKNDFLLGLKICVNFCWIIIMFKIFFWCMIGIDKNVL